ncbi:cytochrome c biogenesis protein CcsA [bacterium]|nr:cytochrome c biogenesis protein CcsA [bacterium]
MKTLICVAAAAYATAGFAFAFRRMRAGFAALAAGWLVNAAVIAVNWTVAGTPPLGSMYHVLVVLAVCLPPLYLFLAVRDRLTWLHAYFAFASVAPLVGALCMNPDTLWRRMPALQSAWFVPHVLAYMLSYALAAVAVVLAVTGMVRGRAGAAGCAVARPRGYDVAAHRILLLGFPFMTFGLLSGMIWADQAWSAYWSWDPKEVWSLITWMLYLVYFHCRKSASLRTWANAAHCLAFAALLTTFLLVNLLPKLSSALHSYATS